MMIRVKKVEYLYEYKLKILFSDGKTKIVDFENWLIKGKGYLELLKDLEFFKKVRLDDCKYSICWPNGADFCPDVLYETGKIMPTKKAIKHIKKPTNPLKDSNKTINKKKLSTK